MADVVFTSLFDDRDLVEGLKRSARAVEQLDDKMQELGDTQRTAFERGGKAANEYDKIMGNLNGSLAEATQSVTDYEAIISEQIDTEKEATRQTGFFSNALENAARRINIFGVNLGRVIGRLRQTRDEMSKNEKAAGGAGRAFQVLSKLGIAGLIVAVVAAIAVFVKFGTNIKATQDRVQALQDKIAGLKAALIPAVETLAVFIRGLAKLGTGNIQAGMADLAEATRKWNQEVLTTIALFTELEAQIRSTDEFERQVRRAAAENIRKAEILKRTAQDTNKSDALRLRALREYDELQTLELKRVKQVSKERLEQAKISAKGVKDTEEEVAARERFAQAEVALDAHLAETARAREEILKAASERRKAEQERVRKAFDQYFKLLDELESRTDKAILERLYDPQKLLLEREMAIKEVNQFFLELSEAAKAAGVEIPEEFQKAFTIMINQIEEDLKEGIKKMSDEAFKETDKTMKSFSARMAKAQADEQKRINEQGALSVFEKFKADALNSLRLNEEQASFIIQSFATVFDSIADLQAIAAQRQLDEQYRIIEASQERVRLLEQDVEREKELKRQGLASNLETAKKALEEEQRIVQAAQDKALAIQKKAANQQLIINSILQASELTVAASKIISANAAIPIAGPVIAAAAIALIFSIIAGAKANAAQFSSVPKLRQGARLEGATHEQGGIPLISDGKLYEAERGEWLIGTAQSKKHDRFLERLNTGQYDGVNLLSVAEQARSNHLGGALLNIRRDEGRLSHAAETQKALFMERAYKDAADRAADKMIEYWKSRPIDTPMDAPIRRERWEGKKRIIETIKPIK